VKNIITHENIKDPKAPEIVLLGLSFESLGPLKILPKIYPPISEPIHVTKIKKNNIFNCIKGDKINNPPQKIKIYVMKKIFINSCFILFFL
jgi:hypothetical protein